MDSRFSNHRGSPLSWLLLSLACCYLGHARLNREVVSISLSFLRCYRRGVDRSATNPLLLGMFFGKQIKMQAVKLCGH